MVIIKSSNYKFPMNLLVRNKRDSAYNTRVIVQYPANIIFVGTEVHIPIRYVELGW